MYLIALLPPPHPTVPRKDSDSIHDGTSRTRECMSNMLIVTLNQREEKKKNDPMCGVGSENADRHVTMNSSIMATRECVC